MNFKLPFTALCTGALLLLVGMPVHAHAQSTITLGSSSSFIDFYTSGSPQGALDVVLGWQPGNNYTGNHTMTGGFTNTTSYGAGASYSLTSYDPIWLQNNGNGNFSAPSSELGNSAFDVFSNTGGTLFSGVLAALSFAQSPTGGNVVSMAATIDGVGSYASTVIDLLASISLAPGGNINDVANSNSDVDEAGMITPEPKSLLLFATGLLALLGLAGGDRLLRGVTAA